MYLGNVEDAEAHAWQVRRSGVRLQALPHAHHAGVPARVSAGFARGKGQRAWGKHAGAAALRLRRPRNLPWSHPPPPPASPSPAAQVAGGHRPTISPDLPQQLQALVAECWAQGPDDRPRSASAQHSPPILGAPSPVGLCVGKACRHELCGLPRRCGVASWLTVLGVQKPLPQPYTLPLSHPLAAWLTWHVACARWSSLARWQQQSTATAPLLAAAPSCEPAVLGLPGRRLARAALRRRSPPCWALPKPRARHCSASCSACPPACQTHIPPAQAAAPRRQRRVQRRSAQHAQHAQQLDAPCND